jgi:hypothetical protein
MHIRVIAVRWKGKKTPTVVVVKMDSALNLRRLSSYGSDLASAWA